MKDVNITIIDRKGEEHQVLAPTDMAMNLMEVVKGFEIVAEETIGICGGMAMCASCQCYVLSDTELNEKEYDEDIMLADAFNVKDNSRLSCQIPITESLEGLKIELAPEEN